MEDLDGFLVFVFEVRFRRLVILLSLAPSRWLLQAVAPGAALRYMAGTALVGAGQVCKAVLLYEPVSRSSIGGGVKYNNTLVANL